MTNMTSEDTVWRSVKAELVRQGSLGAALPLRCEFHGTASGVASAEDFLARCPQGGCDRLCDAVLACGHDCPQVCHTQDREHAAVMYVKHHREGMKR
ncbi:hypothetical protein ONE63_003343 [Megalurothrips usitatus]|uniref:NFX1-type zinc finger-containing protein 1-like n=1 Tax=Megalurothrips usitatus TaxID=439358 RepID=A0AAV7XE06_9NEOP|nr:hypothetical protein ONE63_003343 [Megalurothrips usitatus]